MGKGDVAIRGHSRSALFLTELILAILIFTLCMGVCGGVFVRAFEATSSSTRLNNAVTRAQNAAEAFHAHGDVAPLAERLDGYISGGEEILVYYDRNWEVTRDPADVAFTLRMHISGEGPLKRADIVVSGRKDIYRLTSVKNISIRKG